MTIIQAIFLGIIQGLTEFLPVSSSGHLVLFSQILNVQEPSLIFEVMVHGGTLLAVLVVFHSEVRVLVTSFFKLIRKPKEAKHLVQVDPGVRLLVALVVGTIPAVLVALALKDQITQLFTSGVFVGFMLIVTGTILFVTDRQMGQRKNIENLSFVDALIIGCGQALAILPGISRSGTTIGVGLFKGLDRESAAKFSFLLAIPAILGALVVSIGDVFTGSTVVAVEVLGGGFIAAAITGYLAIRFFLELIKKGKLIWFSYYTWIVGTLVIVLHLV